MFNIFNQISKAGLYLENEISPFLNSSYNTIYKGFCDGSKIYNYGKKVYYILDSGHKAYQLFKKETLTWEEKRAIYIESAMALFQTVDLAVEGTSFFLKNLNHAPAFSRIRLVTSTMIGAIHIVKIAIPFLRSEESSVDHARQFITIVLFRINDTAGIAMLKPCSNSSLYRWIQRLDNVESVVNTAIDTYEGRDKIKTAPFIIARWTRNLFEKMASPSSEISSPLMTLHAEEVEDVFDDFEKGVDNFLQKMKDWENLLEIPKELENDVVFRQAICPLTKKPIRFFVSPQNHPEIFYENAAILELLSSNGDKPPNNWPKDITFCRDNMMNNKGAQYFIDNRLKKIAEELDSKKTIPNEKLDPVFYNDYFQIEKEDYKDFCNKIRNWKNLAQIPKRLWEDEEIFQIARCPLSPLMDEPIRFFASPKGYPDIFYEKKSLKAYMRALDPDLDFGLDRLISPCNWPEDVPFCDENITDNLAAQCFIDNRLKEIAEEWTQAGESI